MPASRSEGAELNEDLSLSTDALSTGKAAAGAPEAAVWDLARLFSGGRPKYDPGPFSEHSTLTFRGKIHRPTPLGYPKVEVELSGGAEHFGPKKDTTEKVF
jgi:hypothetical protein